MVKTGIVCISFNQFISQFILLYSISTEYWTINYMYIKLSHSQIVLQFEFSDIHECF